jgi:hypothetical protein
MPIIVPETLRDAAAHTILFVIWVVLLCERHMPRLITFILVFGSVGYLIWRPADYTPAVQFLISVLLSLAGYWLGSKENAAIAAKHANDRWVPQAESVIFRLMTLRSNVSRLAIESQKQCDEAICDLPDLGQDGFRAMHVKLKSDCRASTQRLADISRQIDDVIGDWRRFVIANCQGTECGRIEEAVATRRNELENELAIESRCREMPRATPKQTPDALQVFSTGEQQQPITRLP